MDFKELKKILLEQTPSVTLRERRDELGELIPEFKETFDFDQKSFWHQYDVYEHTLHVVDETKNDPRLRIAALFHDVGKPRKMFVDEFGEGHFHYHWEESEKTFTKYQDEFDLNEEDIYLIRKLIYYHDLSIRNENIHLFMEEFDEEDIKLLFDLKKADAIAHCEEYAPEKTQELEDAKRKVNEERGRLNLQPIDFSDKKQSANTDSQEEKILLLALLCNNSRDMFTFKTKTQDKEFIVGLSTLDGILSYPIAIEYWDYFEIPEIEKLPYIDLTSNSERLNKLKSIFENKESRKMGK